MTLFQPPFDLPSRREQLQKWSHDIAKLYLLFPNPACDRGWDMTTDERAKAEEVVSN